MCVVQESFHRNAFEKQFDQLIFYSEAPHPLPVINDHSLKSSSLIGWVVPLLTGSIRQRPKWQGVWGGDCNIVERSAWRVVNGQPTVPLCEYGI